MHLSLRCFYLLFVIIELASCNILNDTKIGKSDFLNTSIELRSSSRQDENEIRPCRNQDCTWKGVLEKCPITCRWYDQNPSNGITCGPDPFTCDDVPKDVEYTVYYQPTWCEQKVNCSNETVEQICHVTCKRSWAPTCPSISCVKAKNPICCLDNSTNFLKLNYDVPFGDACKQYNGEDKPMECLDIISCERNVKDDPIRCCEVNCSKAGSKEMCPQACWAYDEYEMCSRYKSCASHASNNGFVIRVCPTKCFNVIENSNCQYPSCDNENDQNGCPITCGKVPFPGVFCGKNNERWKRSFFAKNCSSCQVCGGDCEVMGTACVRKELVKKCNRTLSPNIANLIDCPATIQMEDDQGTFCEELLVVGPKSEEMSEFAPSERLRLGFGIYKHIGFAKLDSPVYMLAKNTTSRISLILKNSDGYWVGWGGYLTGMERWNEWGWNLNFWWFTTFCSNVSITDCKPSSLLGMWWPRNFREKEIKLRCVKPDQTLHPPPPATECSARCFTCFPCPTKSCPCTRWCSKDGFCEGSNDMFFTKTDCRICSSRVSMCTDFPNYYINGIYCNEVLEEGYCKDGKLIDNDLRIEANSDGYSILDACCECGGGIGKKIKPNATELTTEPPFPAAHRPGSSDVFDIVRSSSNHWLMPSKYPSGEPLLLECVANDNWKTCTWKRHGVDSVCKFTYEERTTDTELMKEESANGWEIIQDGCGDGMSFPVNANNSKFSYFVHNQYLDNSYCGLSISKAKLEHAGEWECELEMCNLEKNLGCKFDSHLTPKAKKIIQVNSERIPSGAKIIVPRVHQMMTILLILQLSKNYFD